jgi:hypothetical protein
MKVEGKITKVLETLKGTSAAGKEWQKLSFLLETAEEWNNLYCFEVFGEDKVSDFTKYNKIGQNVDVEFNVKTNEWKEKYYTSLQAWKVMTAKKEEEPAAAMTDVPTDGDLPF